MDINIHRFLYFKWYAWMMCISAHCPCCFNGAEKPNAKGNKLKTRNQGSNGCWRQNMLVELDVTWRLIENTLVALKSVSFVTFYGEMVDELSFLVQSQGA